MVGKGGENCQGVSLNILLFDNFIYVIKFFLGTRFQNSNDNLELTISTVSKCGGVAGWGCPMVGALGLIHQTIPRHLLPSFRYSVCLYRWLSVLDLSVLGLWDIQLK
jgi:hypothetical protein